MDSAVKILCYMPNQANINDHLIYTGYKNLMHEHEVIPAYDHHTVFPGHDVFVVVGTPWVWNRCTGSEKYKRLLQCVQRYKTPKMAVGIGSCYKLGTDLNKHLRSINRDMFKEIWGSFEKIYCRDSMAIKTFEHFGIKAECAADPAYYACPKRHVTRRMLTVFCHPKYSISRSDYTEKEADKYAESLLLGYHDVICYGEMEHRWLSQNKILHEYVFTIDRNIELLSCYENIISGRVHSAIAGSVNARSVVLHPIDSRHLAFEELVYETPYTDLG